MARFAAMAFAVAVAFSGVAGTQSATTAVHLNADDSYLWRMAPSSTFELQWSASSDVTGTLAVSGFGYAATIPVEGTSCTLQLPEATSADRENLYDLTLTLSDGSVRTARLAAVCGTGCGGEAVGAAYRSPDNAKRWARVVGKAVLPIPVGAENLSVDGQSVALGLDGAAGWYHLVCDKLGECALELDGNRQVLRNVGGLFITVR